MPGNYSDTSNIVDGNVANAAHVKGPIDALDDALKALDNALKAEETARLAADANLIAAPYVTMSEDATLTNETTLATALASPPEIGGTTPAAGTFSALQVKPSSGTATLIVDIGQGRNGNGVSGIDLIGDATFTDYGLRINRNGGANGASQILHRGTGEFQFNAQESATIRLLTSGTSRMTVSDSGVGISQNLAVGGSLSKGSGSFKITHPLDSDYWLYHSFIEGPKCDLIYRGIVQLENGYAKVDLNAEAGMRPGTFEALTQNAQVFLQYISGDSWEEVRGRVEGGTLIIESRDFVKTGKSKNHDVIGWMVIAERADALIKAWELTDEDGHLITEHPKTKEEVDK